MEVRISWFIEGIWDAVTDFTLMLVLCNVPIVEAYKVIFQIIMEILSLGYLAKVAVKRSWIVKEAIYSMGTLIGGYMLGDLLTVIISLLAIMIVMWRKLT